MDSDSAAGGTAAGGTAAGDSAAEESIREVAHGDPARQRLLRESLRALAGGAGGSALQEMARDVLAGRVGLRDAALSRYYGAELRPHAEQSIERWQRLSEQERARLVASGAAAMEKLRVAEERNPG
jgi:hypothetical protein